MKKMFVIPFAGGSSASFAGWNRYNREYEFVFLDLPGKGRRMNEPMAKTIDEAIEDIINQILKNIMEEKCESYYIWGHSMGSYIAYEASLKINNMECKRPLCLVMSVSVAPNKIDRQQIKDIPDNEDVFISYLVSLGLISKDLCNKKIMRKIYIPKIRNDYELLINYKPSNNKKCAIKTLILNGKDDDFIVDDIYEWDQFFEQSPQYEFFEGNHFFIFDKKDIVLKAIDKQIVD